MFHFTLVDPVSPFADRQYHRIGLAGNGNCATADPHRSRPIAGYSVFGTPFLGWWAYQAAEVCGASFLLFSSTNGYTTPSQSYQCSLSSWLYCLRCAGLLASVNWFNKVSFWVATEVVQTKKLKVGGGGVASVISNVCMMMTLIISPGYASRNDGTWSRSLSDCSEPFTISKTSTGLLRSLQASITRLSTDWWAES